MSFGLALLAVVAAANPARLRLGVERAAVPEPVLGPIALGALVTLAATAGLVAVGEWALRAIDVSPESFRLAAAVVLVLEGARRLVWARPRAEPVLAGGWAALVPVAFPLLLEPGLVFVALAAGADASTAAAFGSLALALALVAAVGFLPAGPLLPAAARLLAALEIAAGVALAIGAIRDI
jgi:small neutral amino acid transporter SnatA (MarC family)